MSSFNTMKLSDVLVVFVVFLGLFVEYLQYSGYIAIICIIVIDQDLMNNNNNNNNNNLYIGLLFSSQAIGYLLTINLSYKLCIFFGYFIPMIFGSIISIWFTLLFSWNLNNYFMLIICRLIIGSSTTIISTSGWVYILYQFNNNNNNNETDDNMDNKNKNKSIPRLNKKNKKIDIKNNKQNYRNFVANISYLSVSIAWIIGPFISTFLYSYKLSSNGQQLKYIPFYALVGIMILHLILFLFTVITSYFKKNNNLKTFCLKQCCICYYCNITSKYITCSPLNCSINLKWNCFQCDFCSNCNINNINCCSFLFKRSKKYHMRSRSVISHLSSSQALHFFFCFFPCPVEKKHFLCLKRKTMATKTQTGLNINQLHIQCRTS